jgi:hypothetical protein
VATRTYRPLQMHRIAYTDLTESQVAQALRPAASGPLQGDTTVARMARLQGQTATRHWEFGPLEARYVKTKGNWKIASLNYVNA